MNTDAKRTLTFVVLAAISLGAATYSQFRSQPQQSAEYERLGQEFYPDFQDPALATSLKVVVYNEETATVKPFTVELKDGRWRIPSHHNYPADGKDRLAKTAASIIGITRDGLQSRRESDHATYGVLAPDSDDSTELKGRGQRITLTDAGGNVMADYIIGKKIEGETDMYYVRAPKEKETYRVRLKIDLSTKFGDWIEPDLLKLERDSLNDIIVDKYSIAEQGGRLAIANREISELTRKTYSDPWVLKGLTDDSQEVNPDVMRDMVSNLDDLKIVGVRPKPQGIKPDLSLEPSVARNPLAVQALQADLESRGFLIGPDPKVKDGIKLYSNEGELLAGTNEGVRYELHFGEIFAGTEFEIEVGFADGEKKDESKADDEAAKADETKDVGGEKKPEEQKNGNQKTDDKSKRSRYLFVTTSFDEKLIGDEPVKPIEPAKPAGLEEKPAGDGEKNEEPAKKEVPTKSEEKQDDAKSEQKPKEPDSKPAEPAEKGGEGGQANGRDLRGAVAAGPVNSGSADEAAIVLAALQEKAEENVATETPEAKSEEAKPADSKPETPAGDAKPEAEKADAPKGDAPKEGETKPAETKPDPKAEYETALAQYKKDLEKYENDRKERESKIEKGKKKVNDLNKRFGGWYYVISAESFENLRLARKDLIRPKAKPDDKAGAGAEGGNSGLPGGLPPGLNLPGGGSP